MLFTKYCRIYILLTRSPSILSRTIHFFTGDDFTHVSIAFDGRLDSLCSFARFYWALPLPAGLVREGLCKSYYGRHRDMPCMLCSLDVPEPVYAAAREKTAEMLRHSGDYHYSIRGLAMCRIGIAENRPGHYFCSQFVAEVLAGAGAARLPKPPSLMRPQDIASLRELKVLYHGNLQGLDTYLRTCPVSNFENLPISCYSQPRFICRQ